MTPRVRRWVALVLLGAVLPACSSSHHGRGLPPPRQPTSPASSLTTELSFGFQSAAPTNWNPLAAGAGSDALTAVADQVLPSVFTFGPTFNPVLNTTLVQSAAETSTSPQVLVYHINPKATWSDGVPITGADFVYNWQAQAALGNDVGGHPFTPADRSGYDQIQSVTVAAGSPDTVTVSFKSPYPDWASLFRHLIPAHVAQGIGFNSGFIDPVADLVSGGPYMVAGFSPSGLLRLVRNPSFWGSPALTLELDIRFVPDVLQLATALLGAQISCAEVPATPSALSPLRASKALNTMVASGPQYLDLEFQQATGPLRDKSARAAITAAVSRTDLISTLEGPVDPGEPPLANRFLVPGEGGYSAQGPQTPPGTTAQPPTLGPLKLSVDPSDPHAVQAGQLIVQQLAEAGYSVSVTGATGPWDLAVREKTITPLPGQALNAYLSANPSNVDGISQASIDSVIEAAAAARDGQRQGLVDQVDEAAWAAAADLPLMALPQAVVCQTGVVGVGPNASPDGPGYDGASWGLSPGGP